MQVGETLGPYRIVKKIGEGGMGAVYKAHDTRLNRTVAIKCTTIGFRDRFEREARAIAALNHPHVCHLYDVGPDYFVMEYIEGLPLAPIDSTRTLLDVAVQIADALAAAHGLGIVHRDLKPANILLTSPDAATPHQVKVLDFGVALDRRHSGLETGVSLGQARGNAATATGEIVGTIGYMSPEQARGDSPLTPQSDQFSFGLVLYELATGLNPFLRASPPETLTAIIREDPPPLPARLPAQLRSIIERLLSKNPADRYDSTRDLYRELRTLRDRVAESPQTGGSVAPVSLRRTRVWPLAALTITVGAIAAVGAYRWLASRSEEPRLPQQVLRATLDLPGATSPAQVGFAVSPDGSRVIYQQRDATGMRLVVRALAESVEVPVPGGENGMNPFFSPDGQWLGFIKGRQIVKVSLSGGSPVVVAEGVALTGATWGDSGIIVAPVATSTNGPTQTALAMVADTGGTPEAIAPFAVGEATHRWPQFLPGGEHVLYTAHGLLDNFDDAVIRVVSVKTRQSKTLISRGYYGRYLPSGHLLYMHGGVLHGIRFDLASLEVRGKPVPLLDDIASSTAWGAAHFGFSQSGALVYRRPAAASWPLVFMDPAGQTQPLLPKAGNYYAPRISPDGTAVAYSGSPSNGDIHVFEWQRDKLTHLTSDGRGHFSPVWAPDGKHVAYRTFSADAGEFGIDWARADGGGEPLRLLTSRFPLTPGDISVNGDLVYTQGETGYDIWTVGIDLTDPDRPKAGTPSPFLQTPANELQPVFSPDGRWVAYVSNAVGGQRAVFVRPYPVSAKAPERRWQVSTGAGDLPVWSRHGQLFYGFYGTTDPTARLIYTVPYKIAGDVFVAGKAVPWTPAAHLDLDLFRSYDATPKGDRVVVAPLIEPAALERSRMRLALVLNFFDDVRRRIP